METNNNFIIIILIAAGIIGGYIYYTNIASEVFINPALGGKVDDLKKLDGIGLNLSDAELARINALQIFGEYPVNPGTTGKKNIFAPF